MAYEEFEKILQVNADLLHCFSDDDTREILVAPVLKLAGWDPYNRHQIERPGRKRVGAQLGSPDLLVWIRPSYVLVIEVKSPTSVEFNITADWAAKLRLKKHGKRNQLRNDDKDGFGQLRRYLFDLQYPGMVDPNACKGTRPRYRARGILTNGLIWAIVYDPVFYSFRQAFNPVNLKAGGVKKITIAAGSPPRVLHCCLDALIKELRKIGDEVEHSIHWYI